MNQPTFTKVVFLSRFPANSVLGQLNLELDVRTWRLVFEGVATLLPAFIN